MSKINLFTKKQFAFIKHYATTREVQSSAIAAGFSESFAKSKAYQLVKREDVKEEIEKQTKIYFGMRFDGLAITALESLENVVRDETNRNAQLSACKFILEVADIHDARDQTIIILSDQEKREKIDFIKNKFLGREDEK